MVNNRTGCAKALRSYVKEHPGVCVAEIAAAIHRDKTQVIREAHRLATRGMLTKELGADRRNRYTFARPERKKASEAEIKRKRNDYQRARRMAERASKPKTVFVMPTTKNRKPSHVVIKPKAPGGQSVEEFLANGGVVEKLPTKWTTPDRVARA